MKIVIVNTSESSGGAAIAAKRLMNALNKSGQEARMFVLHKQSNESSTYSINNSYVKQKLNLIKFLWERLLIFTTNLFDRKHLFALSLGNVGNDITKYSIIKEADIIHLHWINHGFLSLKNIKQLIKLGKPIVWTMHDMWCFTAVCHYAGDCKKYLTVCEDCPLLKKILLDKTKKVFKKKQKILSQTPIHFVGCSQWMADCARESRILSNASVVSIPNPIDRNIYKPIDKALARRRFNLPLDKKLILFAAARLSDTRKGMSYFIEACKILSNDEVACKQIELVFFGGKIEEDLLQEISLQKHILGKLTFPEDITAAYSACDLFVIPSLEDNLPNTIMESMACGIPCVGFDTGGIPEMIDHKINGYIATYKSAEDLSAGMQWCLEDSRMSELSKQALLKVETCYSEHIVAERYIELYKK